MIRRETLHLILATALAGTALHTARAADMGYVAMLAGSAPQEQFVAHGLLWRCASARCTAPAANSRPAIVCEAVAKAVGPLATFASGGDPFDGEALARCNAAARQRQKLAVK
ncbi:CC_3452 family protein [Sphingobium nicotianae]|uniref:UrcA family protein n=1 Tax=Sphingobium nicotianae TaxID=2782607 RepID=A0A9X1IT60_9SPHN|nr:hypothetical protein [Sphingobium nicotianae]MBT2188970.1 hypothetical protein [Sphingobium nicotianae]